jgi:hypothetical protein
MARRTTITMDDELHAWLMRMPEAAGNSFACDVNETVLTALRCMKGDLPLALLVALCAHARGVSPAQALFGACADPDKAGRLLADAEAAAAGRAEHEARVRRETFSIVPWPGKD